MRYARISRFNQHFAATPVLFKVTCQEDAGRADREATPHSSSNRGSIALGIVVGLLSTSVQSLGLTLQRKSHILEDEKGPYDIVIVVAIAIGTEAVSNLTTLMQHARYRLARGFAYGCISGILSAHSLLVAKSAVELIVRTIADGDNQFVHWQSWMLVLGLVTLALSQLYYLHRGLKLVSTSVLYPLIFCIYNIIAILDGLIYFRQTDLINASRGCLIAIAPGLGLVEDTDGEEEEEEVLLGSDIYENENALPQYAYQTFGSVQVDAAASQQTAVHTPSRQKSFTPSRVSTTRWTERAEIWEALEDRETPESPLSPRNRRRSSTMPSSDTVPLLFPRRGVAGSSSRPPGSAGSGADLTSRPGRDFRRRRKSMGFPGFTARKTWRKSSGGALHEAISGAWRLRWWSRPGTGRQHEAADPVQWRRAATWAHRADVENGAGARDGIYSPSWYGSLGYAQHLYSLGSENAQCSSLEM
ncbi:hypothetical protein P8C59_009348 [Phyllachora maydis]|uniref:Uncharacterized protein n=1 Tax=Phyllachora maydis TaxID=1825666 RepID=A0AAD9ICA9_9PEZI|nr:hypothetical protein P8C59_009348 [Phyllachora maydis]